MLEMNSPIGYIPMVGPRYKSLLSKLEITTVENLLYHFPFRYDDYSQVKKISELQEGDVVTVQAMLSPVQNIFTKYGKRITKAKAVDYTGEIGLLWFNQHYLKNTLKEGKSYNISGKVILYDRKLCFISPDMEEDIGKGSVNTGRLVPIYPETMGVSSKWLRTRINDVISLLKFKEFLPKELMEKKNLKAFGTALKQIHFPDSEQESQISRHRFALEELFLELLNVEKRKQEWSTDSKGIEMKPYIQEVKTLIGSLPFKLTDSQQSALQDILTDMQKESPMNRLLEGDVGTGKTVVALVAAYLAHLNGYKTLYMAPTEILANQHYETFKKLLPQLKINLETSFTKKKKDEETDILIGTHALLYSRDKFENIGLIVIDEQHRFGVEQRGKIMEMSKHKAVPHLISLTATPIPRTLALTLYGDLSITVMRTHPNALRKITTKAIPESSRLKIYEWVKQKNEPTFVVCPLIDESEAVALENVKSAQAEFENLKKVFTNTPMGLLHGRMKSKEKQAIIDQFRKGDIKVLVSTPVIEVGMDVPDATIMVIESAERYGLASLHQLRGRVGRGEKEGFCFAMMSDNSPGGYSRLKNLEKIDNGLELAEIDMKIRGKGDIFGTMQHGFKRLKVADLDDVQMLEEAKLLAQEYYPKLDQYPDLKQKLTERLGEYIPSN